MKILVTGGAGFIGSNVVDSLIKRGDEVIVLDDLSNGRQENINPKARFYKADVRDKKISEIFEKERPQAVIHNAAQLSVRVSVEDPMLDTSINLLGIVNVLDNSVKSGVKRFVFASSGGTVYGHQEYYPADEDHPNKPISPYGVAKFASEKYLYYFYKEYGLEYVALRYANIYGPRQDPYGEAGVMAIFCSKIIGGEYPIINGDGLQTRDYVYVGDTVKANLSALESDFIGEVNIATAKESTVMDLFHILKEVSGKENIQEVHGPAKAGETRRCSLSFELAKKVLGWQPETDLKEGIGLTYRWFEKNR